MKNKIKFLTVITVIAIFGFTFIACPASGTGTPALAGTDPIPVTFTGLTADGSETQTSTQLTLTFSREITGLTADDIILSGVPGISKGELGGSGPAYTLEISGFTAGGNLSVVVAKSGYNISGSPMTISILYIPPETPLTDVSLNSVIADGSATKTTTQLTLTFSQAVTGLTANDITLSGVSGVTKGVFSGSGPTYTLKISGFTKGGNLSVIVGSPSGYNVSGSPRTVTIYRYTSSGGGGGGGGSSGTSTISITGITLVPAALNLTVGFTGNLTATVTPSNATNKTITWSSSNTGVATVSNGTVTAVAPGTATVTVTTQDGNKTAACTVNVSPALTNVSFISVTANGSATQTTTQLTLIFSQAIAGLSADDITLSGISSVTKEAFSGSGTTYTLEISSFTAGGNLSVAVAKSGYNVSGSPKSVDIYYYDGPSTLTITFAQIADAAPSITGPTIYRVSNGGPTSAALTVDNPVQYDSISWRVDNTSVTGTGSSFTLSAANTAYNLIGEHFVTVTVRKGGTPYNKTVSFRVEY